MTSDTSKPSYVDLFAGCGGLSLGLEWAGFRRAAAVEMSLDAARSYHHNLICREEVSRYSWTDFVRSRDLQIRAGLIVADVAQALDALVSSLKLSPPNPDVVAAGPPCQGFSVAGRRDPEDPRNSLIDHVVQAATGLRPTMVLVENVPAMKIPFNGQDYKASGLERLSSKLAGQSYVTSVFRLRSSAVGVPQDRVRLFLLAIRQDLFNALPEYLRRIWRVEDALAELIPASGPPPTVRQALFDIGPSGYRFHHPSDYRQLPYAKSLRFAPACRVPVLTRARRVGGRELRNHELRNHRPDTIARFELYLSLKKLGVHERILNRAMTVSKDKIFSQLQDILAGNGCLHGEAVTLARDLTDRILEHRTGKHCQVVLQADSLARTITTLPDDLIHYEEPRVLSVRELARLQSFPDSFVFMGKPTTGGLSRRIESPQYTQVGNAVPPIMAREVGKLMKRILQCLNPRPAVFGDTR